MALLKASGIADGTFAFSSKFSLYSQTSLAISRLSTISPPRAPLNYTGVFNPIASDAKLADVANFTVTTASIHGTPPQALAFMDINRP